MWIIILVRSAIALTFLILAFGVPYTVLRLRRFIKRYEVAHKALEARVEALERARK